MEKWMVITGIWAMCATCAVLFIRGATCSAAKQMETAPADTQTGQTASETH